jgi:hypothetical protein
MTTRRIYFVLACLMVFTLLAILPLIETVVGIVLLLVFMLAGYVSMRLGVPLLSCSNVCGR